MKRRKLSPPPGHRRGSAKFLTLLKAVWLLVLVAVLPAHADPNEPYAQNVKLDFNLTGVSLEEVIWKMKTQTEFEFFYVSDDVKKIQNISIAVKNASPEEVLDHCLKDTDLNYKIVHKAVIIKKTVKIRAVVSQALEVEREISGTVKDTNGQALPGVTVLVKGTSIGTATNIDGAFSMTVPDDATTLVFTFVGMFAQEVAIGNASTFSVVLEEEAIGLEEVVAIGYGFKKKINVTGAVSSISSETLETAAPVANVTNSLAGRLPGLISKQAGGSPGRDAAQLSIRGFGPALVIVDGVLGSIQDLDPNEIASISVLKDAAAAVYGAQAGNGVILVTTKRGQTGKPKITLNSSYTQQRITNFPRPLNGAQFADWDNEADVNRGIPESEQRFTAEQVQKYYEGTDPAFPSTDWFALSTRPFAPQQQHNLSIRGGSEKIKYFGLIGYLDQETFWKNNGGDFQRYNIRSNIDAEITEGLTMQLGFASINEVRKFPAREGGDDSRALWQDLQTTSPVYASSFPDPTKLPFAENPVGGSILASSDIDKIGYNLGESQFVQVNAALNYDLPFVEGLSARVFANYEQNYSANKTFNKPAPFYSYNPNTEEYQLEGTWSPQASVKERRGRSRIITNQLSLNYDRTFGDHSISALALYETIDYFEDIIFAERNFFLTPAIEYLVGGSVKDQFALGRASEMGRKSYVGRLSYGFRNRYLLEGTLRADASAKFPADTRWGYFPSVSAGWIISEEGFMRNNAPWLEVLKLRASLSNTGYDEVGNFAYLAGYRLSGSYIFNGSDNMPRLRPTGLANPNLTWEELTTYNLGLDFALFGSRIYGEADVFYRQREGILATRRLSLPSTFGADLPPENLNSSNNRGFELLLGIRGNKGDLSYDISANVSWTRAKWDNFDEPDYDAADVDPDIRRLNQRSGQWADRVFGYQTDGLFTSMEEIEALDFVQDELDNVTLRPGDIKYVDTNNDQVLDWRDAVEIGNGNLPHWMYGMNASLTYKNFDLNMLLQGAAGHSVYVRTRVNDVIFREHWTPENNRADALYARNGSIAQGGGFSDFLLHPGGFVRLKSLNLGYRVPEEWLNAVNIRIFAAGNNLFTISELNKFGIDPEAATANPNGGNSFTDSYYPQQRTLTLGINLTL